jgi:predicted 2-oxoglutarate/Fe(II)-dependent dioxygenase YbiX
MEVKTDSKNINYYIRIFDNVLPKDIVNKLRMVCENRKEFHEAAIVGKEKQIVDTKIRNARIWTLKNIDEENLTTIHWTNFIMSVFSEYIKKYCDQIQTVGKVQINDIQILKYTKGGHYVFHVDHGSKISRTLSCIFFINDDYEGGDLLFQTPDKEYSSKIDKISNRMIIWPSNFLYPHCVTPVEKGTRYSIVSWAL